MILFFNLINLKKLSKTIIIWMKIIHKKIIQSINFIPVNAIKRRGNAFGLSIITLLIE